jgi:hypothetical protein
MKILFEHSRIFDERISRIMGDKIDETKLSLVDVFSTKINALWAVNGERLLQTASDLSGFSFKQSEAKCTVTVSKFSSMSHPLILNVAKYVENPNRGAFEEIEETLFHELLHVLLSDNYKVWPTRSVEKYFMNDPNIAAHLHLMSLEKLTHLHLGNVERIKMIERWYERIGGIYQKAWSLISNDDKYLEFLSELNDPDQWQVAKTPNEAAPQTNEGCGRR